MASKSQIKLVNTMQAIMSTEGKILEKDPSRKFLNTHNHFVLLDYDTLLFAWNDSIRVVKASTNKTIFVPTEDFTINRYNELVNALKSSIKNHVVLKGYTGYKNIQEKVEFIRSLKTPSLIFDSNRNLVGALTSNFESISTYVTSHINKIIKLAYAGNMKGILNSGHIYLDKRREYRTPIGFNLDNLSDIFTFLDAYSSGNYDYFITRYFSGVGIEILSGKQVVSESGETRYIANRGGVVFYNQFSNIIEKKYHNKFIMLGTSSISIDKYTTNDGSIDANNNPIFTYAELKKLQDFIADNFKVKGNKLVSKQAINKIKANIQIAKQQLADIHKPYAEHVEQLDVIRNFSSSFAKIGIIVQVLQSDFINSSVLAPQEGRVKPSVLSKLVDASILGKGSPSGLDYLEDMWANSIRGKDTKPYEDTKKVISTTKVQTGSKLSTTKAKATSGIVNTAVSTVKHAQSKLNQLRNLQGRFTSLTSLEVLIRAALPPVLLKNMKRPNLRNQTSRFRDSVELNSLTRGRDGSLVAFLSYMKYPYGTFEKGGKQGSKGYYPSRLIDHSVREIASKLVTERLRVVV